MALIINGQERQTISVKGTEFVQKSPGGVLMNVLAQPGLIVNSHSEFPSIGIPVSPLPDGVLQFWFDIVPWVFTALTVIKYPMVNPSSYAEVIYKQKPLEMTTAQLSNGVSLSSWKTIADVRMGGKGVAFDQATPASFDSPTYLGLTFKYDSVNSAVQVIPGGYQNNFTIGSSEFTAVLSTITQKLED